MHGHKVIEDLKKMHKKYSIFSKECADNTLFISEEIRTSMHFSINDVLGLLEIIKNDKKEYAPFNADEQIKLPYDKIWVEFDMPLEMGGINHYGAFIGTILSLDKKIRITICFKTVGSHWGRYPFYFTIDPKTIKAGIGKVNLADPYKFPKIFKHAEKECLKVLVIIDYFLRLLNCKNISTKNNYPPQKLNKARIKYGKQELFTYKTLVLKLPPDNKNNTCYGLSESNVRIHLCRGHFKTYTKENPLFGKYTGNYWWQPQARGNKNKGMVHKDYIIES